MVDKEDKDEMNVSIEEGMCDHEHGVCTDVAHGTHSGVCRGCGNYAHSLSNDDGWCSDCN